MPHSRQASSLGGWQKLLTVEGGPVVAHLETHAEVFTAGHLQSRWKYTFDLIVLGKYAVSRCPATESATQNWRFKILNPPTKSAIN